MYIKEKNAEFLLDLNKSEIIESINQLSDFGFKVAQNDEMYEFTVGNSVLDWILKGSIKIEIIDESKTNIKLDSKYVSGTNVQQCAIVKRAKNKLIKKAGDNKMFNLILSSTNNMIK